MNTGILIRPWSWGEQVQLNPDQEILMQIEEECIAA